MQQNFLFQAFWQILKSFLHTSTTTTKDGLEGFNASNNNNENNDNIHEDILIVAGYSYANVILVYLYGVSEDLITIKRVQFKKEKY